MIGWIKIDRDIVNHWVWKDDTKLKWWLDMLITVNFKDSKTLMGNQLIECKRGQSTMSLQHWATRWKVDKNKVRNFFVLLEKDGMILHENLSKTTRITICNYDSYQSKGNDTKTQSKRNQNADEMQSNPIEEGKEITKKEKEELFESLWKIYPTKAGKDVALKSFLKLTVLEIERVKIVLPIFSKTKEFDTYNHPHLSTYLNQKRFNDEIIDNTSQSERKVLRLPKEYENYMGMELGLLLSRVKTQKGIEYIPDITKAQYDSLPRDSFNMYESLIKSGNCKIIEE